MVIFHSYVSLPEGSPKMLDFFGEETDGNGRRVVIFMIRSPGGRGKFSILAGHPKFS